MLHLLHMLNIVLTKLKMLALHRFILSFVQSNIKDYYFPEVDEQNQPTSVHFEQIEICSFFIDLSLL